jgi:hypothetical protein
MIDNKYENFVQDPPYIIPKKAAVLVCDWPIKKNLL